MHATYYHDAPIEFPPVLPVPGEAHGEHIGARTPYWPAHPLPSYMEPTFKTMCRYWTIVQEVQAVYLARDILPLYEKVPLAFAEAKFQKLLSWTDTLGKDMSREEYSQIHVANFQ